MIRIRVRLQGDGMSLQAVGHAGRAPRGRDTVCAGVSALLYGFVTYLEGLVPAAETGDEGSVPHMEYAEGEGFLRVETRGLQGEDILGWRVIEAGLCNIQSAYPACVELTIQT